MRHAKTILVGFWLVFLCVCSTHLIGQTTTHGTMTLVYQGGTAQFTLTTAFPGGQPGSGWSVTGQWDTIGGWLALCNPCVGSIDVNGTVVGNDFLGGTANSNASASPPSRYYPSVAWGSLFAPGPSDFTITGPPIPLPPGLVPGLYVGTFSFTGALCGVVVPMYSTCTPNLPNLASAPGTGVVFVTLAQHCNTCQLYATQVMYTF